MLIRIVSFPLANQLNMIIDIIYISINSFHLQLENFILPNHNIQVLVHFIPLIIKNELKMNIGNNILFALWILTFIGKFYIAKSY